MTIQGLQLKYFNNNYDDKNALHHSNQIKSNTKYCITINKYSSENIKHLRTNIHCMNANWKLQRIPRIGSILKFYGTIGMIWDIQLFSSNSRMYYLPTTNKNKLALKLFLKPNLKQLAILLSFDYAIIQ